MNNPKGHDWDDLKKKFGLTYVWVERNKTSTRKNCIICYFPTNTIKRPNHIKMQITNVSSLVLVIMR